MEYYGVKFYGTGDFANAEELKKCEKVFDDYENWNNYTDINKIIELYNVKKYIDTGYYLLIGQMNFIWIFRKSRAQL